MEPVDIANKVQDIMTAFAEESGLSNDERPPRRYLWTDAFALCNFLTLYHQTGEARYRRLALDLIDQVHGVLGRHRKDDARKGWISGLDEAKAAEHPTAGGLRIGKTLNERTADEPFDQRLEWERDGQYFHYLTKWMHALARAGRVVEQPRYSRWALELAKTAHAAFAYVPASGSTPRMYWKMSIDLSRPLVPSMGLHDPLDAFVTYSELRCCARGCSDLATFPDIDDEIAEAAAMCEGMNFVTDDPLGIGGLLFDACRLVQMTVGGGLDAPELLEGLLQSSKIGLDAFLYAEPLKGAVDDRLAFRELGLSIGLRATDRMKALVAENGDLLGDDPLRQIEALTAYEPLRDRIERFWCEPGNQKSAGWQAHQDINRVMLATSLRPEVFLSI
jgi:hypothetical protein